MNEANILLILATSFTVALSGALMPGPLLALTVGESARCGFRAGPLIVLGHGILELGLVAGLVMGLSRFIGNELVFSMVGLVGGIALILMGFSTMKQAWRKADLSVAAATGTTNRTLVLSGILVSASNPYWLIWWATIGVTYLLWSLKLGVTGVAAFFSSHIAADLIWYTLISYIVVKGKNLLNGRVYRIFLLACGCGLIVIGGYFMFHGLKFLLS